MHKLLGQLLILIGCGVMINTECGGCPSNLDESAQSVSNQLTIAVSQFDPSPEGRSWYLSVNSSGRAALTVSGRRESTTTEFQIPATRWAALRSLLDEVRFFELDERQGAVVPDGGETALTIIQGYESHTVRLHRFSSTLDAPEKLKEAVRAVRLAKAIRNLFEDEAAADQRPFYDHFLKDAKEAQVP